MSIKKIICWLPRILGIGFVLFLSLFSLDVFPSYSGWELLPALFMHLIPSLLLLFVLLIAWKYELVGTAVFLLFAIYYVWSVGLDRHWSWYASIALPTGLVGVLFLVSWFGKKHGKK